MHGLRMALRRTPEYSSTLSDAPRCASDGRGVRNILFGWVSRLVQKCRESVLLRSGGFLPCPLTIACSRRGCEMKRRILLVDDEVAVLLTLKAVLEISGFDVDTAASAREGKLKLRSNHYHMVISDMRMESDRAGEEIIEAAQAAVYHPAIALLTAYPLADEDWQELGADQMLVKPMHTRLLLKQIESLLAAHDYRLAETVAEVNAAAMDESS